MQNLHIINVAGLMMDGKDDGIEKALRDAVKPASLITVAPTPPDAAFEHPNKGIARLILMIRETIVGLEKAFENPQIVLVGRSYGAFMALLAAVRMDFEKILKVILIEGPLNPDVTVVPPALLVPLLACRSHYDARPDVTREAAEWLKTNGTEKVVIVQGGAPDAVVENAAQIVSGDFDEFDLDKSTIQQLVRTLVPSTTSTCHGFLFNNDDAEWIKQAQHLKFYHFAPRLDEDTDIISHNRDKSNKKSVSAQTPLAQIMRDSQTEAYP